MTHLLPGCGVPRAHEARSPVPARLPLFASPRAVCHLATIVAGAYPLRRHPNVWAPGVPAPPGPCYWLVASGPPLGWRGGCVAVGLVRGNLCHYCLGGCSALVVCVRRSRQVWGVEAGAGSCVSPVPPPLSLRFSCCVGRVVSSGCPLSSPAGTLCIRSVRSAGSVLLPLRFAQRALCVCVRSRSCANRGLPPSLSRCGARTSRGSGAGRQ